MGKHLEGGRRRGTSDMSSSSRTTRSAQERQSNMMEKNRHWSVSGVAGTGAQRAGAREAAPRYDESQM